MGKHTINWNNYPPIEKCTDMGDTNGNKLDIEIEVAEDRVIPLEEENKENENRY